MQRETARWYSGLIFLAIIASCRSTNPDPAATTMHVRSLVTFGASVDSIDVTAHAPSVSSTGYIAAMLNAPPSGGVAVFDSAGKFVRSIARAGGGPGELRNVQAVGFGPGDTLWIVDNFLFLHAFAPPPGLEYVRTAKSDHVLGNGRVTQFGLLVMPMYLSGSKVQARVVPPALVGWDGTSVTRFGSELPPAESESRIGAVDADHVWVMKKRAHPAWAPDSVLVARKTGPIAIRSLRSLYDASKYFETVIDVFDKRSGAFLQSQTFGGNIAGDSVAQGIICEFTETNDGRVVLTLKSIALAKL